MGKYEEGVDFFIINCSIGNRKGDLIMKNHREEAEKYLSYLRSANERPDTFIDRLWREVNAAGLTLVDLGTSRKELKKLRVKGFKSAAMKFLCSLRNGSMWGDDIIDQVRKDLRRGKLSFADIGTSDTELKKLAIKGYAINARRLVDDLRRYFPQDTNGNYDVHIIWRIRDLAHRGNCTLAEIGTSENELEELQSKWISDGRYSCESYSYSEGDRQGF